MPGNWQKSNEDLAVLNLSCNPGLSRLRFSDPEFVDLLLGFEDSERNFQFGTFHLKIL